MAGTRVELKEVLAVLRAAWWLPVLGLLVGGLAALGLSLLQTPLYTSNTQLFVSTSTPGTSSDVLEGSQFSQERVASYAELLTGEELAGRVIASQGLDLSPADLASEISASAVPSTVLINVSVTDPSPTGARDIAAAVGQEFVSLVDELETPNTGTSPVKVTITDRPEVPSAASSPQSGRSLTLGMVLGLVVGAAVAILRSRLDRSVRSSDAAAEVAGAPVIGVILRDDALREHYTIGRNDPSATAEAFRQLRTNLQYINVDEPPKVIMVSSAVPAEGKTTVAVNLALTLAEAGRRVVLVEADVRRPRVTRYLGMVGGAGLTNILAGSAEVGEVLQTYGDNGMSVIAAGPTPPNPSELLSSAQMSELLSVLRRGNDYVLVDAPPVLPVADASALAVLVDGVLVSIRYGSTRKDQVQQTRVTLDRVGARTLGVVLNSVPPRAETSAAYGYGYGYGYDPERESVEERTT